MGGKGKANALGKGIQEERPGTIRPISNGDGARGDVKNVILGPNGEWYVETWKAKKMVGRHLHGRREPRGLLPKHAQGNLVRGQRGVRDQARRILRGGRIQYNIT